MRCRFIPLLALLALAACAAPAGREAAGTPAARVAAESFATVLSPAEGALLGSAVAIGPRHLLTNAHVTRGVRRVRLQRGDDGAEAVARVAAVSDRTDLAVLEAPAGFLRPARLGVTPPRMGDPVWALGPHRTGRSVAPGRVLEPAARLYGVGQGFTAQAGAVMGFSGGPVVDRNGAVVGLTTAVTGTGGAQILALLSGVDVAGLAWRQARTIFVLGVGPAAAELQRLLGLMGN